MTTLEEQKKLLVPFLQVWPPPPLPPPLPLPCLVCSSAPLCPAGLQASAADQDCKLFRRCAPPPFGRWPARATGTPPNLTSSSFSCCSLLCPAVLQRAQEIERAEPKVAYYCRMYALEQVW